MNRTEWIATTINSLLDGTITKEEAIGFLQEIPNQTNQTINKKITYKNEIHRTTVLQYLKRLEKIYPTGEADREYLSAFYIICSDDEFRRKCLQYVDWEIRGIDFEEMLKEQDFSSGYNVLVRLAYNLFNEGCDVTPMELIRTLSGEYFDLAIQAIMLRKFNGPLYENQL